MKPSMQDIAEAAGTSRAAVSMVLNGLACKHRIADRTRTRILETAQRLGFRRNELAVSVKNGKSKTIAFIGGIRAGYIMEIIAGVNEAAMKAGYTLKLFELNNDNDIEKVASLCLSQMVDGVVCRSLHEDELETLRREFEPQSVPVALVDSSFEHSWCARVVSDDVAGGTSAVRHLAAMGCQRIGLVNIDNASGYAVLRREGYLKGLEKSGLKFTPSLETRFSAKGEIPEKEWRDLLDWLDGNKPDAVFCVSDPLAARVLAAAARLGISVPEDLKVVGYGNLDLAFFAVPQLSSVAQPFYEMGLRTAEELFGAIAGATDFKGKNLTLPVTLVMRDSSKRSLEK